MLRFVLIGAGLLSIAGLTGEAAAADMKAPSYTKAPMAAPVMPYNWTGCHIGGHLGGGETEDKTSNPLGTSRDISADGVVVGGQVGCDYQFAGGWVVGAEGRVAWGDVIASHASTVTNVVTGATLPAQFTLGNNFLASATARLGHTVTDRWLVFVRGGAAWTHEKTSSAFNNLFGVAVEPSVSLDRSGWTAGAGVEWGFAAHWSAVVEYNYYDFGTASPVVLTNPIPLTTVTFTGLRNTIQTGTVGVNYHF